MDKDKASLPGSANSRRLFSRGYMAVCSLAGGRSVVVCALYRSGSLSGDDTGVLEYIDRALDHARTVGSHVILLAGNFNVHNAAWLMSNKTTKAGELAEDICNHHGSEQHVHIPNRGPNTLDLIFSDFPGNITVTGHPPLGASDHICLLAIIPEPALRERPTKRTVWPYQEADWDRLRHSYRTSDWESCFIDNPDQSCEYVSRKILSGMKHLISSRILV